MRHLGSEEGLNSEVPCDEFIWRKIVHTCPTISCFSAPLSLNASLSPLTASLLSYSALSCNSAVWLRSPRRLDIMTLSRNEIIALSQMHRSSEAFTACRLGLGVLQSRNGHLGPRNIPVSIFCVELLKSVMCYKQMALESLHISEHRDSDACGCVWMLDNYWQSWETTEGSARSPDGGLSCILNAVIVHFPWVQVHVLAFWRANELASIC